MEALPAVFRIRISLNADPDPGFYLNADPDPDSGFWIPDSGFRIPESGLWTLDSGFGIFIQGFFCPKIKINGNVF